MIDIDIDIDVPRYLHIFITQRQLRRNGQVRIQGSNNNLKCNPSLGSFV
jgi:hypothetical protein